MTDVQELTSPVSALLSDADWAKISTAGRLSGEFRSRINQAFADYRIGRASDIVSPATIALTVQIQGRIKKLVGLIKNLALNDEYRLARSAPELPKANLALLSQSVTQLELLSEEMESAKQRLSAMKDFEIEDPLIDFFFALMCIQADCLKRCPPTSYSSSSSVYKYIECCAKLAEPCIFQSRRFNPALKQTLRMFNDLRTGDPEDWPNYFDGSPT